MKYYDQLVKDFLLEQWKKNWYAQKYPYTPISIDRVYHLKMCETTQLHVSHAGWTCGCYSEVTRDDVFAVSVVIGCNCGEYYRWFDSSDNFVYYREQGFLSQLEEFESTYGCIYEEGVEW